MFARTDAFKPEETYVNIEYLTWPIIRYKREVLFGWVDLLVSFGGIAGLFLGFSLLSGVEIIYYFTMRACCMLYQNRVYNKQLRNCTINSISNSNNIFLYIFFYQEELNEIEEEKLLSIQKRYDLSLKLRLEKQSPQTETNVNIIKVSSSINDWNLEPPTKAVDMEHTITLPNNRFTTNRADLKLQAAQVFFFYFN